MDKSKLEGLNYKLGRYELLIEIMDDELEEDLIEKIKSTRIEFLKRKQEFYNEYKEIQNEIKKLKSPLYEALNGEQK